VLEKYGPIILEKKKNQVVGFTSKAHLSQFLEEK
jgi:hypothetical protein